MISMRWYITCDFKGCPNNVSFNADRELVGLAASGALLTQLAGVGWSLGEPGYLCPLHGADGGRGAPVKAPVLSTSRT